ncbi:GWT1-domain-containing protein [Sporodiniella umbellata]|nr:GWT1-domain-containing protein [Sporodiniella umbellata]
MISDEEYKLAKEAHVSNCTGGSSFEISSVCYSLILSHWVWNLLVDTKWIQQDSFTPQFIIYVLSLLSCITWASDYVYAIPVLLCVFYLFTQQSTVSKEQQDKKSQPHSMHRSFLTVYRAGLMFMTCAAILAVDFQSFPRRFAKVETFGTSLMDVGVGAFVFSSGVVASRSYLRQCPSFLSSLRSGLVILLLGLARFFLTKSVNYQEHHSEYGLHWNFFFTLGFLPPCVSLLGSLRRYLPFFVPALFIIVSYQAAMMMGLQDWILNAPRVDLISANKEGVCSFFGYLSIFMFGLQCGELIFENKYIQVSNLRLSPATSLMISSLVLHTLVKTWAFFLPEYSVSRGMANLPYVFWVVALNLELLGAIMFLENNVLQTKNSAPSLLEAANINGLFVFLLANIMTGLVNLSMRTLYMNNWSSFLVNICYLWIVSFVSFVLWTKYQIKIKL